MNKLIDTKGLKRAIENIKSFINKNYITKVTYAELVALTSDSKLIPGKQYRIIDYVTTTVQENTRSAGHQFDIIVTADTECFLNAVARATWHEGDDYFGDQNLNAWQIWYCLENDTNRFVWVDDENGKGVIYRMIDEYGNDCPYDFKNIQYECGLFEYGKVTFDLDNADFIKYFYTFSWLDTIDDDSETKDCSIIGNNGILLSDEGSISGVKDNIIKNLYEEHNRYKLNNIVFLSTSEYDNGLFYGYNCNIIEYWSYNIAIYNECKYNYIYKSNNVHIIDNSYYNKIYNSSNVKILGYENIIEHNCSDINIEGDANKVCKKNNYITIEGNINIINEDCSRININGDLNKVHKKCNNIDIGKNVKSSNNIVKEYCSVCTINNSYNTIYEKSDNCTCDNASTIGRDCSTCIAQNSSKIGDRCYLVNAYVASIIFENCTNIEATNSTVNKNSSGINVEYSYIGERNYFIEGRYFVTENDVFGLKNNEKITLSKNNEFINDKYVCRFKFDSTDNSININNKSIHYSVEAHDGNHILLTIDTNLPKTNNMYIDECYISDPVFISFIDDINFGTEFNILDQEINIFNNNNLLSFQIELTIDTNRDIVGMFYSLEFDDFYIGISDEALGGTFYFRF